MGQKIDLNAQDENGRTGFHHACMSGNLDIIETMIDNAECLKIDLNIEDAMGCTGYWIAENLGRIDVVNLIKNKCLDNNF